MFQFPQIPVPGTTIPLLSPVIDWWPHNPGGMPMWLAVLIWLVGAALVGTLLGWMRDGLPGASTSVHAAAKRRHRKRRQHPIDATPLATRPMLGSGCCE
ncbi:MAG: hypothetical protein ACHQ9S_18100 [Candidatus Binatia bacterium]